MYVRKEEERDLWEGKHERERARSARLQELDDELKKQLQAEAAAKQRVADEKAALDRELEQCKDNVMREQQQRVISEDNALSKQAELDTLRYQFETARSARAALEAKLAVLEDEKTKLLSTNVEIVRQLREQEQASQEKAAQEEQARQEQASQEEASKELASRIAASRQNSKEDYLDEQ
eukprot:SM000306S11737  [mRNA]  locus=s306:89525:91098:+ [translate_table: standard]